MEVPGFRIEWGIPPESILDVRQRNLYPEQELNREKALQVFHDGEGVVCAAAMVVDEITGCVTVMEEYHDGMQLRIRWLGVDDAWRGKGMGTALTRKVQEYATKLQKGIWCNVRIKAIPVYQGLGFVIQGKAFEIPGVGSHVRMTWRG